MYEHTPGKRPRHHHTHHRAVINSGLRIFLDAMQSRTPRLSPSFLGMLA